MQVKYLDEPSFFYRCVESSVRQEEDRRTDACEALAPRESIVPTEMRIQLFDSDNPYAPIAAAIMVNEDSLGSVDLDVGSTTCHLFDRICATQ